MCAQLEGVQGGMRAILWYASHSNARTDGKRPHGQWLKH